MSFDIHVTAVRLQMAHVNTKWNQSWSKIVCRSVKVARSWTKLVPNTTKLGPSRLGIRILNDFTGPTQALGPSQRVRGGTKEAPRRHRGGTRAAPRRPRGGSRDDSSNDFGIDMGPRAPFKSNKVLEHITVNQSLGSR